MKRSRILKCIIVLLLGITLISLTGCTNNENMQENNEVNGGKKANTKGSLIDQGIKVGDYVNYDATSGEGANQTYTVDTNKSGTESDKAETYKSSDITKWRVLSIKDGKIELLAEESPCDLALNGAEGYKNAEIILNEIGAIFGKGNGAVGGRSINIDDIDQYSTFDKTTYQNDNGKYGETKVFTTGTFIMEDGTEKVASSSQPVEIKITEYGYKIKEYIKDDTIRKMFEKVNFTWLASRCVGYSEYGGYACFGVRYFVGKSKGILTNFGSTWTFFSNGAKEGNHYFVTPVVTLETGIRGEKGSDGVWNLDV